jgi:hypothetical protein
MKYLKSFEGYEGPIFPKSKFNKEEMDDLYDAFQDIAHEYNIKDMTIKTSSHITSNFDDDPDTGEINQYIIGLARNAYIDIRLFQNEDEIIDTLRNNFVPQIKSLGWELYNFIVDDDENDIETPYKQVSITFAKPD